MGTEGGQSRGGILTPRVGPSVWNSKLLPLHSRRKYTVRLGDHSLRDREGSEQEMEVAQSIPHPCYNRSSDNNSHDIMLIRLRGRVNFGPKVKPIKLPDYCPKAGQKCRISGWGTVTSPEGSGRERRR